MLQSLGGTPEQCSATEINECAILQDVAFIVYLLKFLDSLIIISPYIIADVLTYGLTLLLCRTRLTQTEDIPAHGTFTP